MNYYNEKPTIAKRKPHKWKAKIITKSETCKPLFEQFLEFKIKQNLRPDYKPQAAETIGLADATIETRIRNLKHLSIGVLNKECFRRTPSIHEMVLEKMLIRLKFYLVSNWIIYWQ